MDIFLENNLDGLQYTKEWLRDSFEALNKLHEALSPSKESPPQTLTSPNSGTSLTISAATQTSTASLSVKVTPAGVISHAYVQLLIWPDSKPLPEVCPLHNFT